MEFRVAFVGDDELPRGHDWAMIHTAGEVVFAVKESRVTPRVLEEAWRGYRVLALQTPALRAAV